MSYIKTSYSLTSINDAKIAIKALVQWINQELTKIEDDSRRPLVRGLSFEKLQTVPEKYQEGDLYYFAAGVAGAPGLFIRDANSWRKL